MKMYKTRNAAVLVCLVPIFVVSVFGQTKTSTARENQCKFQQTCAECIRTPDCEWCGEKQMMPNGLNVTSPLRCRETPPPGTKTPRKTWCPQNMIVNPSSFIDIVDKKPFSSVKDQQVQVTPQYVKMILRRGQTKTLKIRYQQAEDYPVDLYFLMDLSASMEPHKNNLSKLGKKLETEMRKLTRNVQLGFGSFVDKVLLPMTNSQPEWLETCTLMDRKTRCATPYGYQNQMKLTHIYTEFQGNVERAPISGNLDAPEGGLDALMQTMVCWDHIGWRKNARHILVYSSDATYHIAGDGKLAGLIEPNDEQCHMNDAGFYTYSKILDYPSISQINKQALENNINIIFAVAGSQVAEYTELSLRINRSSVGILDVDSDSVVALVRDEYKKLTNTIIMTSNETRSLDLKYYTTCVNSSRQERKDCSGVRVSTPLEFDVEITAVECPEQMEDWTQRIKIQPQGVNEMVIVDIELLCDCPCSRPGSKTYEPDSQLCYENGNLTCGVCDCKEDFFGKDCKCKRDNKDLEDDSTVEPCRGEDDKICSGRGTCICGVCKCNTRANKDEIFSGEFCQCDNFSCQRIDGKVCGGPENGECKCGVCSCKAGLGGDSCNCRTSNSTCMPPGENTTSCNGYGECKCGHCDCTLTSGRSGEFCQECPTCPTQRCDELKSCVECFAHNSGSEYAKSEGCDGCKHIAHELVDDIDEDPTAVHPEGTHVCVVPDSSGCTFVFTYLVGRGDVSIMEVAAEKAKKCPEPLVSPLGVAGSAIGITLFLGLLGLLVWKVLTMFHDHHEWVKFEKERVCASFERGENPIFKEPTTSFHNPTFDGVKG